MGRPGLTCDTSVVNVVGHRGASVAERENSPAAFEAADRMGADGVELDVRLAPDGRGDFRLVVFHDPLPTSQHDLDALPGLDDVLRACGRRMLINVEIKNSDDDGGFDPEMAVVAPTIAAMRRFDPINTGRWLVSSFTVETIDRVRLAGPEFATALLCSAFDESTIGAAVDGGHVAIHPWHDLLDAGSVEAAHRAGLLVNTWTVNDPARMTELAELGVDGICTDVPDIARTALGQTGAPTPTPTWGFSSGDEGRPA